MVPSEPPRRWRPERLGHALTAILIVGGCLQEYDIAESDAESETDSDTATDVETATDADPACGVDEIACDGVCVDPFDDAEHCGGCGRACVEQTDCFEGECARPCVDGCDEHTQYCEGEVCACREGWTSCSGECVDLRTDFFHCGQCFASCDEGQACGAGICRSPDCDRLDACTDACTDLDIDPGHCGGCDEPCFADEICSSGVCHEFSLEDCDSCPCVACEGETCCESDEYIDAPFCTTAPQCP